MVSIIICIFAVRMMKLGLSGNALKVIAIVAILIIGRNRGDFSKQMLWMMFIITLYAVGFFIFHSKTYGMVHMACWLTVPLLAMYNGERGRCSWLGKFFYYYYPIHMALIGLLARIV